MHGRGALLVLLLLIAWTPLDLPSGCESCETAYFNPVGDVAQVSQICQCDGILCWVRTTLGANAADRGHVLTSSRVCAEPCPGACVVPGGVDISNPRMGEEGL